MKCSSGAACCGLSCVGWVETRKIYSPGGASAGMKNSWMVLLLPGICQLTDGLSGRLAKDSSA